MRKNTSHPRELLLSVAKLNCGIERHAIASSFLVGELPIDRFGLLFLNRSHGLIGDCFDDFDLDEMTG